MDRCGLVSSVRRKGCPAGSPLPSLTFRPRLRQDGGHTIRDQVGGFTVDFINLVLTELALPKVDILQRHQEDHAGPGFFICAIKRRLPCIRSQPHGAGERMNVAAGAERVARMLTAMTMEVTALAKACGKSSVHNLEPEDLRALSFEASAFTGVKMAGIDRPFDWPIARQG